jgi:hypothetical protein
VHVGRTTLVTGAVATVVLGVVALLGSAPLPEDPPPLTEVLGSREVLGATSGARALLAVGPGGTEVLAGLGRVYERAGLAPPPVVPAQAAPGVAGGYLAHAPVGRDGDPTSKLRGFASILAGPAGDTVSVAVLALAAADVTARTDVPALFARYERTLARVASRRPDLVVVPATVPLAADRGTWGSLWALVGRDDELPADNVARERFNAMLRREYAGTDRLWDVAAIGSTAPDGTRALGRDGDLTYPVLDDDYADGPTRLNELGAAATASALVALIAEHAWA